MQEKLENPKVKKFNLPQKLEYINQAGYARAVLTPEGLKNVISRLGNRGTFSIGASASGTAGAAGTAAIQYTFDAQGNVALQVTYGGGGGGLGASAEILFTHTNAPNYKGTNGYALQVGGSGGGFITAGADYIYTAPDALGHNYEGFDLNAGVGIGPLDLHGMVTKTETLNEDPEGNVPNMMDIPFVHNMMMKTYDCALIDAIAQKGNHPYVW